jgi:putative hydrolase of the HAD superfamily
MPSNPTPMFKALIFDFDGLIVDTESTGYLTWKHLFARHGEDLPASLYAQVVGTDFDNAPYHPQRDLEQRLGRQLDWTSLEAERRAHEAELRKTLQTLPGVRDRLQEARQLGWKTAIASSSPRWWIDSWMSQLGISDQFDHFSTVDDTGKVKPDPSLYLHALAGLGVSAKEALVFEDSLNGLTAAIAAELRCIVAPGPMTKHMDFSKAWKRVQSLTEVSLRDL